MTIDYKNSWYLTKPDYKDFDADSEYWKMKYDDRWTRILSYLPVKTAINPRLLEIGCGLGRASDHFKRHGARVTGVEPADYAIANNRLDKDELIHGDFLDVNIVDMFDVVYIEQVLSHIPAYHDVLVKANRLMPVGGLIVIEEPNDFNHLQNRLVRHTGQYWVTDDHVNYFDFESMTDELESIGFNVVMRSCTWPMELFEMMGLHYVGDDVAGKKVHQLRTNMLKEMGYELRMAIKDSFARMGLGRDLFIIAQKISEA